MGTVHSFHRNILSVIAGFIFSSVGFAGTTANPVPLVNAPLVPSATVPGGPAFTLTVNGTGFVSGSVVNWDGSPRTTNVVSESQVAASISASDIASATTASITVTNPGPGGGTSNVAYFSVTVPKSTAPFTTTPMSFGGQGGGQIAVGDFNGDGKPDLVALTWLSPSFLFLSGNGDGTFQVSRPPLSLPNPALSLVAADFNGDGKLDLAMSEWSPGGQIEVLLGNGDGTFQTAQSFPSGGSQGNGIVAADLNGDGRLDLVVANDIGNSISVFLGNGDGTFQPHMDIASMNQPEGISVGDFNGDGKLDLAIVETGSSSIVILLGNGDGTFTPGTALTPGNFPAYIAVADFNNDGKLDLVVSEGLNEPTSDLRVFLGNGDGTFQSGVAYALSNDLYRQVIAADINGDGKVDLVVGVECCGVHSDTIAVLLGNGDGTFGAAKYYPVVAGPFYVAATDLNGDGSMDIIGSVPSGKGTLSVMLQTPAVFSPGSLSFGTVGVGSSQTPKTATLTNVGWGPLQLTGVSIKGTNARDFSQTNNCPGSLVQGASCAINVTFAPTSDGARAATLRVADAGATQLQGVALKGTGTFAGLSPTSVTFGNQAVGTSSNPQTVTLTNLGRAALSKIKIVFTGTDFLDFTETSTCGAPLDSGASCAIKVVFKPHATGSRGGSLNVRATGASNPAPVPLRGTGD